MDRFVAISEAAVAQVQPAGRPSDPALVKEQAFAVVTFLGGFLFRLAYGIARLDRPERLEAHLRELGSLIDSRRFTPSHRSGLSIPFDRRSFGLRREGAREGQGRRKDPMTASKPERPAFLRLLLCGAAGESNPLQKVS
jgi:hypothetical protein